MSWRKPQNRMSRSSASDGAVEADQHVQGQPLAHHELLHVLQLGPGVGHQTQQVAGQPRPVATGHPDQQRQLSSASMPRSSPSPTPAARSAAAGDPQRRPPVTRSASPSASTPTPSTSTSPTATNRCAYARLGQLARLPGTDGGHPQRARRRAEGDRRLGARTRTPPAPSRRRGRPASTSRWAYAGAAPARPVAATSARSAPAPRPGRIEPVGVVPLGVDDPRPGAHPLRQPG